MSGFEVHDLGIDVPSIRFIDTAEELQADIIGMSAFLTTTIPGVVEVLSYLRDMGIRNKYKVIIGGGGTSLAYAKSVGADGWAANASEAVKLCNSLVR